MWQGQIISTISLRAAPPDTIFSITAFQSEMGKTHLVKYLQAEFGALELTGTDLAEDKKRIKAAFIQTEEMAQNNIRTQFQEQPILIWPFARDDPRLLHKNLYSNMEHIIDGSFLEGGWTADGERPAPWAFAIGNNMLDADKMSPRFLKGCIIDDDSPHALVWNKRFENLVQAKASKQAWLAKLQKESAITGDSEGVLIFKHLFMQGEGTAETTNIAVIVNELIQYHDFFKKFKKGGVSDRTDAEGFKKWMKANFPELVLKMPNGYPAYAGLKRKRE
tara:strand:- start:5670 stop:6500 length:831 start_codon:yes stop_codon:yes gene_type:complete